MIDANTLKNMIIELAAYQVSQASQEDIEAWAAEYLRAQLWGYDPSQVEALYQQAGL